MKYNVFAQNLKTSAKRIIAENKTQKAAEAIVDMAAMRRGVEEEFFFVEPVQENQHD